MPTEAQAKVPKKKAAAKSRKTSVPAPRENEIEEGLSAEAAALLAEALSSPAAVAPPPPIVAQQSSAASISSTGKSPSFITLGSPARIRREASNVARTIVSAFQEQGARAIARRPGGDKKVIREGQKAGRKSKTMHDGARPRLAHLFSHPS
jgi:hypothetical protein